ncbi:MAG: Lrp/AsnC ligand binding domain-containing protein [Deltaproteobacteria bacterium]|nr:Lrp/AsnC ligand binding domain-containing protein [Deltaproteobacteria bacterium]
MVTAIILLNVERRKINDVAQQLAAMGDVSEVFSVSGNYDLIAIVRVKTNDDLSEFVTNHLATIEAVEKTNTMLAFKAYSKYDLESMFSIGSS